MLDAPLSILAYRLTDHASIELKRRQISEEMIASVLASPEQIEIIREGRAVYQSRMNLDQPPKTFLVRVFVDYDRNLPDVVTAYRTSKIEKYWRPE